MEGEELEVRLASLCGLGKALCLPDVSTECRTPGDRWGPDRLAVVEAWWLSPGRWELLLAQALATLGLSANREDAVDVVFDFHARGRMRKALIRYDPGRGATVCLRRYMMFRIRRYALERIIPWWRLGLTFGGRPPQRISSPPQASVNGPDALDHLVSEEQLHRVQKRFATLKEVDKKIVRLRLCLGEPMTHEDVATALNMTTTAVRARYARAVRRLLECLDNPDEPRRSR